MVDIDSQIRHWEQSGREDWAVACDLVERGRLRHGLFFAHLALEKMLKAGVCRHTGDVAPRMHNLVRLGEMAGLSMAPAQLDLLADMNRYNLEGRYSDPAVAPLKKHEAGDLMVRAERMMEWLSQRS